MARNAVNCPDLPSAGPYSHSVAANGQIFVSGQLPISPDSGAFVGDGVSEQTRQSLENVAAILSMHGVTMDAVVKCTIFLTDMADFPTVNEVYSEFFRGPMPARSAFAVVALPGGARVEIEAVAVLDS